MAQMLLVKLGLMPLAEPWSAGIVDSAAQRGALLLTGELGLRRRMKQEMSQLKVAIQVERRADGGVRVSSKDVPGLVLSGADMHKVLADVVPAIEVILSEQIGCEVSCSWLVPVRELIKAASARDEAWPRRTGAVSDFPNMHFEDLKPKSHRHLELAAACG